jgi:DNA (cytosine-5)-methyltransferase 1
MPPSSPTTCPAASSPARRPKQYAGRAKAYKHDGRELTLMDWFAGAGGSTQGADAVPGVRVTRAANHWRRAMETHQRNFGDVAHYIGDIRKAPVWAWPITDMHWASPECTRWSIAQGKKRSFAKAVQGDLLDLYAELEDEQFQTGEHNSGPTEEEEASRALMEEVPLYLRGVIERGHLVKAGIVENVTDVRAWFEWDRWVAEFHKMGYHTRLIALNSMHADPRSVRRAPQSRDRLYFAYWHKSLGRTPNWPKWLDPRAWCGACGEWVRAVQTWRRPGVDMGRYKQQYDYRCPNTACGRQIVEPEVLPAFAAIDFSIEGTRIGDRKTPLAAKTMRRIQAGLDRFARPLLVPTGGTWREAATDLFEPMPTRTTRENDALVVPPLLVPCDGREGKHARTAYEPLVTQTTRAEAGLAWLPFITEIRGGSSDARSTADPLATVCASGNHHGLVTPPGQQSWDSLLVPYYGNGAARTVREPVGALTTRDRYALVTNEIRIEDVLFRMLQPSEIQAAMAFAEEYIVLGSKRDQVRQLGNAVTPPAAEILICALAECITGEEITRYADRDDFATAA